MAKRLVLNTNEGTITVKDLEDYLARIVTFNIGPRTPIRVSVDDGDVLFYVPIPEGVDARGQEIKKGPRIPVKEKRKKEKVVKQIVEHRQKTAAGEKVAYVPPVGGKKKRKRVKRTSA